MSLFDYPRINIKGTLQLNPGTANNDDFAGPVTLPSNWGPFAGETLALIDSAMVEPRTYGMSDADFIAWVQQPQTFNSSSLPPVQQIIPAEWNYYGDMGSEVVSASVIGVQTGPGQIYTEPDPAVPLASLIGASLDFSGSICDVNSQGSPPATQFFIEELTLKSGDTVALQGKPSKGACQWLNFYRNVSLQADGGAGGYVYHVILKDARGTKIDLPGFNDKNIKGVIFRYYLYRPLIGVKQNADVAAKYAKKEINPATLEFIATIAPLYDEPILTTPVGRLLVGNNATIPTPNGAPNNSGNGFIALAPAVLQQNGSTLSAEFVGTFPDYYQQPDNPKYDFGPVSLVAVSGGSSTTIATVDYADTDAGDRRGWIFDFDLSAYPNVLNDPGATFQLVSATWGTVLAETDYYVVSNQQGIYAEQFGPGDVFLNQGTTEAATVSVYSRGNLVPREKCPPITVWQYRSIPLQAPGNATVVSANFKPGDPIVVDTSAPGNYLFTFSVNGPDSAPPAAYPPMSYATFMNPPWITNAPGISLRILPNGEDFSRYYVDPSAKKPVGNELLTFDVVYTKVLRTYYLLFPAMNKYIDLSKESDVRDHAQKILDATDPAIWMSVHYMPRTRDMSASRRTLLQAWCRKVK